MGAQEKKLAPLSRFVLCTRSVCLSGSGGCAFGDSESGSSLPREARKITYGVAAGEQDLSPRAARGARGEVDVVSNRDVGSASFRPLIRT